MQVNLGEKIRELRKRDGRKQEDLAKALGVTPQAVSRWEGNGGYPDMGMIPAIANFFHVTIDELFGYDNDRETKVREYNEQASLMMTKGEKTQEIITFLRKGLEEFPTESSLKERLGHALVFEGWKHQEDKPNPYWTEAATLFEEVVDEIPAATESLVNVYALLGQIEKAEETASKQPPIAMSRQILLARVFDAKRGEEYRGEAILELLHELRFFIETAVAFNDELLNSREGLEILALERELLAKILGENCLGYHNDLCFVDCQMVKIACNLSDYDAALQYFDKAFDQCMKAENWKKMVRAHDEAARTQKMKQPAEEKHLGTTLLRSVDLDGKTIYVFEKKFLAERLDSFPTDIAQQIRNKLKYRELFEE